MKADNQSKKVYYFAYGSNMDAPQMAQRCPNANKIGIGILLNHKIITSHYSPSWDGGVFSVAPNSTTDVKGVIYDVTPSCVSSLDHFERYPKIYSKQEITIIDENNKGKEYSCLIYISNFNEDIAVSARYLDVCQSAAIANGFNLTFN